MSDHIEAMAMLLFDRLGYEGTPNPALFADVADAWAAGVGALIAHQPCGGIGIQSAYDPATMHGPSMTPCLGPHTTIGRGDGTKLYADKRLVLDFRPYNAAVVPLPSEWRIE